MIGAVSAHDDLDQHARERLAKLDADAPAGSARDPELLTLFDAMAGSRLLDIHARRMRERGHGYYTIGSAGHEGNAAVAAALEPTDPALLHYRSGAFYLARAAQYRDKDGLRDILLGVAAATSEPIS
ncbi:MAG: 2-oxoisovalerate dehydrogenase component, partial [Pseudonocardiales bacterium]|nr:2-oxoisovalerate dehydrogenase component [Pseudonocardiales bacterium]